MTTYAALPLPRGAETSRPHLERLAQPVPHRPPATFYPLAVAFALAVGGVWVAIGPRGIVYDPWMWLNWGRELVHGTFTTAGSQTSFKPLPVAVTTAFGWTPADPTIWLVIARAGAVFGAIVAFRVGRRLAGPAAGFIAAVGLLASREYLYRGAGGNAEPIGAALTLLAIDAHLSRRRGVAVAMLALAGLVRIEMWAYVLVYGLWWLHSSRGQVLLNRRRAVALAVVLVVLPMAWFLPDFFSTGDLIRSAQAATQGTNGGPLLAAVPFLATLKEAAGLVPWPFLVAFCLELVIGAVVFVRRRRVRSSWVLAVAALSLVLVEAVMAQLHLDTGVPRYLMQSVAVGSVVAGCVAVDAARRLLRWVRRAVRRVEAAGQPMPDWVGPVAALAIPVVVLLAAAPSIPRTSQYAYGMRVNRAFAQLAQQMPRAISQAGGRAHILACGPVETTDIQVPMVAWVLDLRPEQVGIQPGPTGTVFSRGHDLPAVPATWYHRYTTVGDTAASGPRWREQTTCPPAR